MKDTMNSTNKKTLTKKKSTAYCSTLGAITLAASALACINAVQAKPISLIASKHQQLVLVISSDWHANQGKQYRFERISNQWVQVGNKINVSLGRAGLAWGIGLHPKQSGAKKQEGDGKAPAGIFSLGTAFGYFPKITTGLNYKQMTRNDYCIDVNGSPYYNQIISKADFGELAIQGSSEPMRRDIHLGGDQVYKKGFIIEHNRQNISTKGSCIFSHIWKSPSSPTAGCTAMAEDNLDTLVQWLSKEKSPVYVALPQVEYHKKMTEWGLPEIKQR